MRAYGGLAALLIVVGLGIWIWSMSAATTIEKSRPAVQDANQFSGRDREGRGIKANEGIKLEPMPATGPLRSLIVDDITDDNPLATFYGLKRNDCIVQAGSFDFRDTDASIAIPMVFQE
ncbi:MAG: hypothetical protein ACHRHE_08165, partial [Tepidisphaerales bacterium]